VNSVVIYTVLFYKDTINVHTCRPQDVSLINTHGPIILLGGSKDVTQRCHAAWPERVPSRGKHHEGAQSSLYCTTTWSGAWWKEHDVGKYLQ